MGALTTFKGITSISGVTFSDQAEANLLDFFNWGMLQIGAFTNINVPTTSFFGDQSLLRCVDDPNFETGQVWEANRYNWVWESGVDQQAIQPLAISGVYINSTFYPSSTSGTYEFYVDYPKGRLVFNNSIPTNSLVQCPHSVKWVLFGVAESDHFRSAIHDAYDTNNPTFSHFGSGNWQQLAQDRVQYPFVAIEIVPRGGIDRGYQLGGGAWYDQDVLFHIFAENRTDRNKINDIILYQESKSIFFYDLAKVAANNDFPLDGNGSTTPIAKTYPQMVGDPDGTGTYRYNKVFFKKAMSDVTNQLTPRIFHSIVRVTLEAPMANLY